MGGKTKGIDWGLNLGLSEKVAGLLGEDGQVFTVNPSGGADFLSSQEAIDACVDNRGDVIVRYPGGEEVTATVAFNKKGISYIPMGFGANPIAKGELFSIYAAAALVDVPVAIITKRCYIEGIAFISRDSISTFYAGAALLIGGDADATPFGVHLFQCRFPKWGLDNSIGLAIEGSSDCRIEECGFEGVGSNFDAGIYVQGATANLDIINCVFRDCTYGIEYGAFAGGGPDALIKGCSFIGSKILTAPSAAPTILADLYSMLATDSGSYNTTVNALNALGIQMSDVHYAE